AWLRPASRRTSREPSRRLSANQSADCTPGPGFLLRAGRSGRLLPMARLLVVHHTPSPATQELLEAALAGARHPDIPGVEVVVRPALVAAAVELLEADGYLL